MKGNTDHILFSKIQNSDRKAYETFFRMYYHRLCAYSESIVEQSYAEEIVQDVMLSIWENRENIIINNSIAQYLYGAVRKRCLTHLRRNKMMRRVHEFLYDEKEPFLNEVDLIHANEVSEKISKSIEELPHNFKEAFKMSRFENNTYKEISEKLDISIKSVDYRIQQALSLLREKLKDYQ